MIYTKMNQSQVSARQERIYNNDNKKKTPHLEGDQELRKKTNRSLSHPELRFIKVKWLDSNAPPTYIQANTAFVRYSP